MASGGPSVSLQVIVPAGLEEERVVRNIELKEAVLGAPEVNAGALFVRGGQALAFGVKIIISKYQN